MNLENIHTCIHASIHPYKHTYINTYINTDIHILRAYMHACMYTYIRIRLPYVYVYIYIYLFIYMYICSVLSLCVSMLGPVLLRPVMFYVSVCAYVYTYIYIEHVHTYIFLYRHIQVALIRSFPRPRGRLAAALPAWPANISLLRTLIIR